MPLWDFHVSPGLLSPEEKKSLAEQITKIYSILPAFYVQVRFTEDQPSSMYVGGEEHLKFAGIQIVHLARQFTSAEHKKRFLGAADAVLNPILKAKGAEWEYWITEASPDLWKINGIVPPPAGSDSEKEWRRLNKAFEYEGKL